MKIGHTKYNNNYTTIILIRATQNTNAAKESSTK
jgi:hypothetical protein